MASPLTVTRNDYRRNKKSSSIYTPTGVAQFLYGILDPIIRPSDRPLDQAFIFDPAIGTGRLTDPWHRLATQSSDATSKPILRIERK